MLQILAYVVWLGALICAIMVIVKMFQTAGPVQGIIGIVCGLWAFIWGWMNVDKVGKNVMLAWTGLIVLAIVLGVLGGVFSVSTSTSLTR